MTASQSDTADKPCTSLREPFYRTGWCLNCKWLSCLHTESGWSDFYTERAIACAKEADAHEDRATKLRASEQENLRLAEQFPYSETSCIDSKESK